MPRSPIAPEIAKALVYAVQKRPVIYDATREDFKNRNVTEVAWWEVSRETGIDVSLCRSSWSQLKCSFLRILWKRNMPNVSGKTRNVKWYLYPHMLFLKKFVGYQGRGSGNHSVAALQDGQSTAETKTERTTELTAEWTGKLEMECHDTESLPSSAMSGGSSPVNIYLSDSEPQHSAESLTLPGPSGSGTAALVETIQNGATSQLPTSTPSGSGTAAWVESIQNGATPQHLTSTPARNGEKRGAGKNLLEDLIKELLEQRKANADKEVKSWLKGLEPLAEQLSYRNKLKFFRQATNCLLDLLEEQNLEVG